MAKAPDFTSYPPVYFDIIKHIATHGSYSSFGTRADCHALRFDLYAFKRALQRAAHPDYQLARQITWYLREAPSAAQAECELIGIRKDKTKLSLMAEAGLLRDSRRTLQEPSAIFPSEPVRLYENEAHNSEAPSAPITQAQMEAQIMAEGRETAKRAEAALANWLKGGDKGNK